MMQAPMVLLVVSLLIGLVLQWVKAIPGNAHVALNSYVIYVALPALGLIHVPGIELQTELLFPIATGWILFLTAIPVVLMAARSFRWSRQTTGCLILTAGLGNTAFLGYPVIEALYGADGVQVAILVDQPGTFIVTSSLGIVIAGIFSEGRKRKREVARNVVTFPPFVIFIIALAMNVSGIQATGIPLQVLEVFAATLTPVALISIGLQLKISGAGDQMRPLAFGLLYKLMLAPALIFTLYVMIFGQEGLLIQVSIVQAAMPPMITGYIIAAAYGLNSHLAALMAGVGVPVAAVTITFWYTLLGGYG